MKQEPKVTFLISMYNTNKDQLEQAIKSVLTQDYNNYDILIIDDGSDDGSLQLVENFHSEKINIICNEKNIGLEKSLNKGIYNISSKYIARMDTDDICFPERLKKQVNFAENNPEYSIVSSSVNFLMKMEYMEQQRKLVKSKRKIYYLEHHLYIQACL